MNALKKEIEWTIERIEELRNKHKVSHLVFAFPRVKSEHGLRDPSVFVLAAILKAQQQNIEHPRRELTTVEVEGVKSLAMSLSSKV